MEYYRRVRYYEDCDDDVEGPDYATAARCGRVLSAFESAAEAPVEHWLTSVDPWDRVIQQGIREFGERERFTELASFAAGIRSRGEQCLDSPDLFDANRPLVRRARYARMRAGSRKWWSRQLHTASKADERWMVLLLFSTWAGTKTVEGLVKIVDARMGTLGDSDWHRLYWALRRVVGAHHNGPWVRPLGVDVNALPRSLSARTATVLMERCSQAKATQLYERYLSDYRGDDSVIVSLCASELLRYAVQDETKWPQAMEGLKRAYKQGVFTRGVLFEHLEYDQTLPHTVASEVVDHPVEYPASLVSMAEATCRQRDGDLISPVGQVAIDEDWFAD